MADPDRTIQTFVSSQKSLLDSELRSEELEESEAAAAASSSSFSKPLGDASSRDKADEERPQNVLRGLEVESLSVGLYGRTVATLTARSGGADGTGPGGDDEAAQGAYTNSKAGGSSGGGLPLLPAHRLTVGDEVEILSKSSRGHQNAGKKKGGGRSSRFTPGGVICAVSETEVSIALFGNGGRNNNGKGAAAEDDDDDDDDDAYGLGKPPLSVVPRSSADVHRKMVAALDDLARSGVGHPVAGNVVRALFCPESESTGRAGTVPTTATKPGGGESGARKEAYNPNLDPSQLDAIDFALSADRGPLALIHGPPGTGKTTTLVELIRRAVYDLGWRVLVCAPSNVAVDNVLEKLVEGPNTVRWGTKCKTQGRRRQKDVIDNEQQPPRKIKAVRMGHPARIRPSTQIHSLESLVQNADGTDVVNDVRAELKSYVGVLSNPKARGSDRRMARREVKVLRAELRRREEAVVKELVGNADVVLATTVGAGSSILDRCLGGRGGNGAAGGAKGFDLVVIDEAAQSLEASCWIPILRGRRLVLAGDHKQLPPTIKSRNGAVVRGLGRTMFERVMELYGDDIAGDAAARGGKDNGIGKGLVSRMLRVQYRMHADIADWASGATYGGKLISHDAVKGHKLTDLPHVNNSDDNNADDAPTTASTLVLIDTAGCDLHESTNSSGSRYNEGEAQIVMSHVTSLLSEGVKAEEIAVISPYNGQVELLRSLLLPGVPNLEIRSVDGFQGGEREAVVLSLVRSSDGRGAGVASIGFLKDERRLNVAVTRARRHCAVICDTETVSRSGFIRDLASWMEERGEYRTAMEFESRMDGAIALDSSLLLPVHPSQKVKEQFQSSNTAKKSKGIEAHTKTRKPTPEEAKAERRKELMDKINGFAERGKKGDELILNASLSKFDRLIVHELAEQLGLGHRSVGVDGINRRIIVTVLKEVATQAKDKMSESKKETSTPTSAFATLDVGDDSSDSETSDNEPAEVKKRAHNSAANSLLGSLAKERMERQQQQQQPAKPVPKVGEKGKKKKKKKKKNSSKKSNQPENVNETADATDGLDDMAFLDAQIDKVQTSHGRTVEGSGKGYKSIINGVLLSKPTPPAPQKDARASAALKSRLKSAEDGRKSKGGKKKKK